MSLVLDALNKARQEEEGQHLAAQLHPAPRPASAGWLKWGLAALAVVNLGLLAWIMLGSPNDDAPTAASASPEQGAAPGDRTPATERPATPSVRTAEPRRPQTGTPTEPGASPETAVTAPPRRIPKPASGSPSSRTPAPVVARDSWVPLHSLPADERATFTALGISSHLYSADDASLRGIYAGGTRYGEGEIVGGMRVMAITETGVVLEQRTDDGTRAVEINVAEDL